MKRLAMFGAMWATVAAVSCCSEPPSAPVMKTPPDSIIGWDSVIVCQKTVPFGDSLEICVPRKVRRNLPTR